MTFPAAVNGSSTPLEVSTAQKLLDFSQKLDINLLDNVVQAMYSTTGNDQRMAQEILTRLKEHPDAWTRVDTILEYSQHQQTKYFALQILETVIKTRWKILPRNQCEGIRKYIVGLIIKYSQDADSISAGKVYLNKLNMVLVLILKREWPKNWPTFISDIVGASKINENLCRNNMVILKLLSEELFDFSCGAMTQTKAKHLKETMCNEFSQVYTLCLYVMENSCDVLLVEATLETLLRFLNWIPLGYIFETKLIENLISKFLHVNLFRNVTLKCLTEIGAVQTEAYHDQFEILFVETMKLMTQIIPMDTNIKAAYAAGSDMEQKFIQNLALFLCTMLKMRTNLMDSRNQTSVVLEALKLLLLISEVEDVEIFKICLEYWGYLAQELYRNTDMTSMHTTLIIPFERDARQARRKLYAPVLTQLRYIMIGRMAKPEEVLVVENDQGEVVREFMKDTDSMTLYKNMRECLVYLTHLDCQDTDRIMTEKLHRQVNGSEWSWKNLNTLCWAIGSISGAMHEEDEKRFLVTVIKDLLGLCEQKRGKDNKAIIASNIMYVVGQYPRFLRAHWKFLKTVVNKLFEFMHETHEGVQDMACDTFIKIAQKCKRHFVQVQVGEVKPFIEEILGNISSIIYDLQPQQVHTFCEAVGYMISSETEQARQERLIEKYMQLPNLIWDDIINQATKNVDILKDPDAVKQLGNILKTNYRACKSLGHPYVTQLGRIYLDMLNVYKVMSENICVAIQSHGDGVTKQPLIRSMRTVKKDVLKLIGCWVSKSDDPKLVLDNFIQPLLDAVLQDYLICPVAEAREPEVLQTMTTIISRMNGMIQPFVPTVFDALFQVTLEMINKDFEEFPEHRLHLYQLLLSMVSLTFPALIQLSPDKFKLVLDSIVWAFKHTMRNVADTGLEILLVLLKKVAAEEMAAQQFYQTFFTDILQHLFSVVTDTSHSAGLAQQAVILAYMFALVDSGKITAPLAPGITDNTLYVQQFVANLLKTAFPHLTDNQVKITVQGFINLDQNVPQFKEHLRDFLVQIREFTGEDDSDLYLDEREAALRQAETEKRKQQMSVPGILNPHEISEEMQD